jgi:hypothetical protein
MLITSSFDLEIGMLFKVPENDAWGIVTHTNDNGEFSICWLRDPPEPNGTGIWRICSPQRYMSSLSVGYEVIVK